MARDRHHHLLFCRNLALDDMHILIKAYSVYVIQYSAYVQFIRLNLRLTGQSNIRAKLKKLSEQNCQMI